MKPMPELPEVETIRKDLQKELVGLKILGFETDWPKSVKPSEKFVKEKIVGSTIRSVDRYAKLLVFNLSNNFKIVIHLKISGRLLIRKQGDPPDEYTHHVFKLSQGRQLRFADLRKFGYIKVLSQAEAATALETFGPEPLSRELDAERFFEIIKKYKKPIKLVLMDQAIVAGVGNIYANEALFLAKIHPERKASRLSRPESDRLYQKIEQVLKEGLKYRGASDNAYLDAYGRKGSYQEHFRVYSRKDEPCLGKCGGLVEYKKLGGRGTFFCPKCQVKETGMTNFSLL